MCTHNYSFNDSQQMFWEAQTLGKIWYGVQDATSFRETSVYLSSIQHNTLTPCMFVLIHLK